MSDKQSREEKTLTLLLVIKLPYQPTKPPEIGAWHCLMMKIDLDKDPVGKLLFNYSFPAITGMLISALYMIVDGIFVGQFVGPDGLAAINIAYPIIMLGTSASMMFGIGGSTVISVIRGQGNHTTEAGKYLTQIILMILVSWLIILTVTFSTYETLIYRLGSNEHLFPIVKDYLLTLTSFLIFFMLSIALNAVVRNDESPVYAMIAMGIGTIVNIGLDWLFIAEYGMGMKGAALATGIAQTASFVFLAGHFFRKKCTIRPAITGFMRSHIQRIMDNGFPSFVMEIAFAIVMVAFNNVLMVYMGQIGTSAYGAICYVFYIFIMIFTGLAQGLQPIVSYSYGARQFDRMKETLVLVQRTAFVIASGIFLLVFFKSELLIQIFNSDPELVAVGSHGLMIYTSAIVFLGANFVNIAYLQSMEKPKTANILSLLRSTVFVLPSLIILPKLLGNDGIWLSMPLADVMTFAVFLVVRNHKSNKDTLTPKALSV
ncbi:MATE family efflux transporter [Endozoicomonas ascidiicola]|uniref:MATE family efflux transporter n=2 Tax=Endozoicomonas ascidiicola TaxID=1698521 RepID=UPI0015616894|nr:MATE family efflux transporter [Endozoicomonas ascidiicola]